jgi:hypothetical protein
MKMVFCLTRQSIYGNISHFIEKDDLEFVVRVLKDNWNEFFPDVTLDSVTDWPTEWQPETDGKSVYISNPGLYMHIHPVLCVNGTYIHMNYFDPCDLEDMKVLSVKSD